MLSFVIAFNSVADILEPWTLMELHHPGLGHSFYFHVLGRWHSWRKVLPCVLLLNNVNNVVNLACMCKSCMKTLLRTQHTKFSTKTHRIQEIRQQIYKPVSHNHDPAVGDVTSCRCSSPPPTIPENRETHVFKMLKPSLSEGCSPENQLLAASLLPPALVECCSASQPVQNMNAIRGFVYHEKWYVKKIVLSRLPAELNQQWHSVAYSWYVQQTSCSPISWQPSWDQWLWQPATCNDNHHSNAGINISNSSKVPQAAPYPASSFQLHL